MTSIVETQLFWCCGFCFVLFSSLLWDWWLLLYLYLIIFLLTHPPRPKHPQTSLTPTPRVQFTQTENLELNKRIDTLIWFHTSCYCRGTIYSACLRSEVKVHNKVQGRTGSKSSEDASEQHRVDRGGKQVSSAPCLCPCRCLLQHTAHTHIT